MQDPNISEQFMVLILFVEPKLHLPVKKIVANKAITIFALCGFKVSPRPICPKPQDHLLRCLCSTP